MNTTEHDNNNDRYRMCPGRSRPRGYTPRAFSLFALALLMAQCLGANAQRTATAVATVELGVVVGIQVTDGGSGYVTAPAVSLVGGGGELAIAIAQVSDGMVSAVIVLSGGFGFTAAPTVVIAPPPVPTAVTLGVGPGPTLTIHGPAGTEVEVQYANRLGQDSQWFTLTNIVMGDGPYVLLDVNTPVGGMRFYRAAPPSGPRPDPARWARIEPGTFTMGSPETEYDRSDDEGPQTAVTLSRGFWMGRFEVTQGEYTAVIGTNHSTFSGDPAQPVEQVSWFDATNYCAQLTSQEHAAGRLPDGYVYRLPTEAEWEYAARAGTTNRFFFGDDHNYTQLPDYAWFEANSAGSTHDVGGKQSNSWGLYDTSGNVFEWCADWYGPYPGGAITDPTGPASGEGRVMRGGSWRYPGGDARSAARNFNVPDFASFGIGIRVVLAAAPH